MTNSAPLSLDLAPDAVVRIRKTTKNGRFEVKHVENLSLESSTGSPAIWADAAAAKDFNHAWVIISKCRGYTDNTDIVKHEINKFLDAELYSNQRQITIVMDLFTPTARQRLARNSSGRQVLECVMQDLYASATSWAKDIITNPVLSGDEKTKTLDIDAWKQSQSVYVKLNEFSTPREALQRFVLNQGQIYGVRGMYYPNQTARQAANPPPHQALDNTQLNGSQPSTFSAPPTDSDEFLAAVQASPILNTLFQNLTALQARNNDLTETIQQERQHRKTEISVLRAELLTKVEDSSRQLNENTLRLDKNSRRLEDMDEKLLFLDKAARYDQHESNIQELKQDIKAMKKGNITLKTTSQPIQTQTSEVTEQSDYISLVSNNGGENDVLDRLLALEQRAEKLEDYAIDDEASIAYLNSLNIETKMRTIRQILTNPRGIIARLKVAARVSDDDNTTWPRDNPQPPRKRRRHDEVDDDDEE